MVLFEFWRCWDQGSLRPKRVVEQFIFFGISGLEHTTAHEWRGLQLLVAKHFDNLPGASGVGLIFRDEIIEFDTALEAVQFLK